MGERQAAILAVGAKEEAVLREEAVHREEAVLREAGQATESGWNLVLGITFKCLSHSARQPHRLPPARKQIFKTLKRWGWVGFTVKHCGSPADSLSSVTPSTARAVNSDPKLSSIALSQHPPRPGSLPGTHSRPPAQSVACSMM